MLRGPRFKARQENALRVVLAPPSVGAYICKALNSCETHYVQVEGIATNLGTTKEVALTWPKLLREWSFTWWRPLQLPTPTQLQSRDCCAGMSARATPYSQSMVGFTLLSLAMFAVRHKRLEGSSSWSD